MPMLDDYLISEYILINASSFFVSLKKKAPIAAKAYMKMISTRSSVDSSVKNGRPRPPSSPIE
jgi:hypothetical protein